MRTRWIAVLVGFLQVALAARVLWRLLKSAGGQSIKQRKQLVSDERVAVLVPVLNEYNRLTPCLEGLLRQGEEVVEILVIDGGSQDDTQRLVQQFTLQDPRIRLIDASPVPASWNGKAWGLQVGLQSLRSNARWVLTLDADVHPAPLLSRSLLGFAQEQRLDALSIATKQELHTSGEGLLHPSLLTTLIYRFGIPGRTFHAVHHVQANGQCFLLQRHVLEQQDGFVATRHSICEDVTLARLLVKQGYRVGFYQAEQLISVRMYEDGRAVWQNWTRSLPMRDQFSGLHTLWSWLEVLLVQALPLPLLLASALLRDRFLLIINIVLTILRLGVLTGTASAYVRRPWTYWLSPLADLAVALKLADMALRKRHTWRGRELVREEDYADLTSR